MPPPATTNLGYTPPDGGWGWAVVLASFISIGFSYAFPKSLTVYFKEIQEYFGVSYSEIAWVSSVMLATMYAAGFGLAFNLQPALTIIGTYFQAKRPLANGLAMTGSPVVLFTLAPLNQFLFDSFGWRGSFLILGAIVLNCCVAGSLMRPVNKMAVPKPKAEPAEVNGAEDAAAEALRTEDNPKSQSCVHRFIDFSLFKHRGFLIYLVGNVVMFFGFFAPVVFLAPYAKHQGIDEYSAAFLLSIFALADMFIRPATGFIGNTKWIRPKIQYFFAFAVSYNGVCHLLCPLLPGYAGLVVYAVFFGFAFGMLSALLFETLMDLVGAKRFSTAVGLCTIIECGPVLLGPPMSGALVDIFGDYKYMYYTCGVFMLVPGLFFFIMHYYNYRKVEEEKHRAAVEMRTAEDRVHLNIDQKDKSEDVMEK
ncbi:hypothetical protein NL108_006366 [Boleophthalmus pectinirostris]|nr:hypothetical protein NL108_006366 [Boleophthalmus pectinirostris]